MRFAVFSDAFRSFRSWWLSPSERDFLVPLSALFGLALGRLALTWLGIEQCRTVSMVPTSVAIAGVCATVTGALVARVTLRNAKELPPSGELQRSRLKRSLRQIAIALLLPFVLAPIAFYTVALFLGVIAQYLPGDDRVVAGVVVQMHDSARGACRSGADVELFDTRDTVRICQETVVRRQFTHVNLVPGMQIHVHLTDTVLGTVVTNIAAMRSAS